MIEVQTIRTATHTAYIEVMTGQGLLVLPDPDDDDLRDPLTLGGTLEASDWEAMILRLRSVGFTWSRDMDGGTLDDDPTLDGHSVIGLEMIGEPTQRIDDVLDLLPGMHALRQAAGMRPLRG